MNQPTLDTLTERLDRLERENRWWKIIGSTAVAVLSLVLIVGAAPQKVLDEIKAKRFVVVDDSGGIRAELRGDLGGDALAKLGKADPLYGMKVSGAPSALILYNVDKQPRVVLALVRSALKAKTGELQWDALPDLTLLGKDGRPMAELEVYFGDPDLVELTFFKGNERSFHVTNSPSLDLWGKDSAAGLSALDGYAGMTLSGEKDQSVWLTAAKNETFLKLAAGPPDPDALRQAREIVKKDYPNLSEKYREGFARSSVEGHAIKLSVADKKTNLTFFDNKGVPRLTLGNTELMKPRTETVEQLPASSVVLFDKDGKVIWKAP